MCVTGAAGRQGLGAAVCPGDTWSQASSTGRGTMSQPKQDVDNRNAPPAIVVIFGASGDLTRRKLVPAIQSLARHGRLTEHFAVVGVARTPMDDEQFAAAVGLAT